MSFQFLSTLPARGATARSAAARLALQISIHAPREGSDAGLPLRLYQVSNISIHAPREGSDLMNTGSEPSEQAFLSTLPARGATLSAQRGCWQIRISIHAPREGSDSTPPRPVRPPTNFYPRSPRGERRIGGDLLITYGAISIHAPREGSDLSDLHPVR